MSYVPSEPVVLLTASDVDMLWRSAGLDELRRRHRIGDTRLYSLLVKLHSVRLLRVIDAGSGIPERHDAASEHREVWTTQQLAATTGRAERTIRQDIADGRLTATRPGRGWIITAADATAYIQSRRKT